jgi:arsenate reductase
MPIEIWINPACSKCRSATELLERAGVTYEVRRYLETPPTAEELAAVLGRLGFDPWDLARLGEPVATELGLQSLPKDEAHREQWISAMVAHPALIQRPILTASDGTTVVGRTPEAIEQLLAAEQGR